MADGRRTGGSSRITSAGVVIAIVVVLAGAVLAASAGSAGSSPAVRPPDIGVLVWIVVAALLLFGVYILVSLVRTLERGELRANSAKTIFDMVTLIAFIGMVILLLRLLPRDPADARPPPVGGEDVTETAPPVADDRGDWATLAVVAGVALLICWRRLRNRERLTLPPDEDRPLASDVADVLDDAIARLRAEPDPRRAIIASYARMEDVFAHHGLPRRPSEAPLEFLVRALEQVTATEPARRLTDLFERAMFSTHPFDRRAQLEAVDALQSVRDDLLAGAR
jgi:Domain of unknown function (DUF4129)